MNVKVYEHDFYDIHFIQGIFKGIGNIGFRKQMKKRNPLCHLPQNRLALNIWRSIM